MGTPFLPGIKIANIFYGILSSIITVIAVLVMAAPELLPIGEDYFEMPALLAGAGFIAALYSGVSFRFIAEEKPRLAATIDAVLITVLLLSAVATTKEPLIFIGLYLIAMILVGFGSFMSVFFTGLINLGLVAVMYLELYEINLDDGLVWPLSGLTLSFLSAIVVAFAHRDKRPKKSKKKQVKTSTGPITSDILIDAIADGVAIVDTNNLLTVFNPSAQKITGWSDQEAEGLDYRSVLVFVDGQGTPLPDMQNPISKAIHSGEPVTDHTAVMQTRSKKQLEVDVLASPISSGGSTSGVVVIFRDVSKQRSEERQRAEFISTASHEMRTPVAAIEGYLALALNDKVSKIDSAARGYLEKAHASTQHLGKLFQDLLTAAKSEDGRLTNNPEVVEMGHLLDELAEGVSFTAEKKGLQLKYDNGQKEQGPQTVRPVAYVYVDAERIREVITNLFDNAVKYTEEGSITIGMQADEKNVVVTVSDTGAGIPKEDIPHLFQKFYRVDNSATRQVGGTGLGLFISRKIVEMYQGRIWVESDINKGSTFFISLPRLSAEKAQELMKQEVANKSPLDSPTATTASSQAQSAAQTAPAAPAPAPGSEVKPNA